MSTEEGYSGSLAAQQCPADISDPRERVEYQRSVNGKSSRSSHDADARDGSEQPSGSTDRAANEEEEMASGKDKAKRFSLFKTTARKVQRNKALTRVLAQDAKRHLKMYTVAAEGNEREIFTFNVRSFFPECQSCSGLSERVKIILTKPSWSRNKDELEIVRRFVMKLTCFGRYSVYVRQELAHVIFYEVFERGRVVIRQGDVGYSFYFIASGSVLVEIQDRDPVSGVVRTNIVGELGAGSTFGDLALLNDDKRRATIVCKEDCEFLKVDKTDFKKILMESCRENWAQSNAVLSQHPLFRGWSKSQLKLAVEGSQFVEFTSNSVIIKDFSEPSENVFVVTRGKCLVIQRVTLLSSKAGTLRLYEQTKSMLPPIQANSNSDPSCIPTGRKEKESRRWWLLRTLYPGDYFGVGEGPSNSSVICADMAECLLVNTIVLARHAQGRYLDTVLAEAKTFYPTLEAAFKSYIEGKQWDEYKKKVLDEVVSNSRRRRNDHTMPSKS